MLKNILSALIILLASFTYYSFAHDLKKPEPLFGFSIFEESITIMVRSTGCTKAKDFRVDILNEGQENVLSVYRTKRDRCRAMTRIIPINLQLNTQQDKSYRVANLFYRSQNL